jgi:hypothetical protein
VKTSVVPFTCPVKMPCVAEKMMTCVLEQQYSPATLFAAQPGYLRVGRCGGGDNEQRAGSSRCDGSEFEIASYVYAVNVFEKKGWVLLSYASLTNHVVWVQQASLNNANAANDKLQARVVTLEGK